MTFVVEIAVPAPAHSAIGETLSYAHHSALVAGTLVRVPLGRREVLGLVWSCAPAPALTSVGGPSDTANPASPDPVEQALKPVAAVLQGLPPLGQAWLALVGFAARYYQRALGEVALAALPPPLRELSNVQLARRLKRASTGGTDAVADHRPAEAEIDLTAEQRQALDRIEAAAGPFLLFGSTGSGKTEVYLRAVAAALSRDAAAQALVMVPEINLTPQLEARFRERFEPLVGAGRVVSMHSGMTHPQRLASWLKAHSGEARIVLGTRLAVFASMPGLAIIVVDEEHDASYKQQDGARYGARDLAVWRGHAGGAKVILGSATPSLESWQQSRPADGADPGGRYVRLSMPSRIGVAAAPTNGAADHAPGRAGSSRAETASFVGFPAVRTVDMSQQPTRTVLAPVLVEAIGQRIARGEQSLLLLNRRGYAPVLGCNACDWKSECPHCSAYRVFHKIDRTLRCHHCGLAERVPRACPSCGNPDIAPIGRGTERLEEHLLGLFAPMQRPGGGAVRIERIDADSTRKSGALAQQLAQVHGGAVDVLVGTQMIAKGHDFRRVTLVAALNPDGALFSSDFRAPERLFSLLLQAAGRAGRDSAWLAAQGHAAEMWLQTSHPRHALFAALRRHDYPGFAAAELAERRAAGLPPFASQALLRADARSQATAQAFLSAADTVAEQLSAASAVTRYPAVPLPVQRVANIERAQMLVESPSRAALQRFLADWQPLLQTMRREPVGKGVLRWGIDVDPQAI